MMDEDRDKPRTLKDGTVVVYCWPHRRWEWDCECGQVMSSTSHACSNCGRGRTSSATKKEDMR